MHTIRRSLTFILLLFGAALCASTWEPPITVSPAAGTLSRIVSDDKGNAALVWLDDVNQINVSYRPLGGVWETPMIYTKRVRGDISGTHFGICMDGAGNITVVWAALDSGIEGRTLEAIFRPSGGTWPTASTVIQTANGLQITSFANVSIDCVSNNTQAILAARALGPTETVQSLHRTGTTWTTSSQRVNSVGETVDTLTRPIAQILPDGTSYIAMRVTDTSSVTDIFLAGRAPGGTWTSPSSTSANFTGTLGNVPTAFDFDMNPSGQGIIGAELTTGQIAGAFVQGGATTTPGIVTTILSKSIGVGIDGNGQASMIWQTDTGSNIQLATAHIPTFSWQISTISSGSGNSNPLIDVSTNGGVVAAWSDSNNQILGKVGFNGAVEATPTIIDTTALPESVSISNSGIAFASWVDTNIGRVDASRTIIEANSLVGALGLKRLIYQKGLYP